MKNSLENEINKIEKEKDFLSTREVLEESRRLALLFPAYEDMEKLLEWRNEKTFLDGCTHRNSKISMKEFEEELKSDFEFDRHIQTIIYNKKKKEKIGTLWSYQYNDNSVYISTYLDPKNQKKSYGVEAFVDFMKFLFEKEGIDKIYTEVYSNNDLSLKTMLSGGFEILDIDNNKKRIKKGEEVKVIKLVFDKNNEKQVERMSEVLSFFKKRDE